MGSVPPEPTPSPENKASGELSPPPQPPTLSTPISAPKPVEAKPSSLRFTLAWAVLMLICFILPNAVMDFVYSSLAPILFVLPSVIFITVCAKSSVCWSRTIGMLALAALCNLILFCICSLNFLDCAGDVAPGYGISEACSGGGGTVRTMLIGAVTFYSLFLYRATKTKPRPVAKENSPTGPKE